MACKRLLAKDFLELFTNYLHNIIYNPRCPHLNHKFLLLAHVITSTLLLPMKSDWSRKFFTGSKINSDVSFAHSDQSVRIFWTTTIVISHQHLCSATHAVDSFHSSAFCVETFGCFCQLLLLLLLVPHYNAMRFLQW